MIIGNVQWLHKDINSIKRNYAQDYIISMCKIITNYQKGKNYDYSKIAI